jgi:mannose-6-phosphate isomerase-like protein (cupin superfamily)
MLKRILHAVPISMSDFFAFKLEREERVFYREHDLIEIGSGAISFRQVGKDLANHSLQILYECYRPGADTGRSPLTHESEEGGIVIAGRLEVTVGSQTQVLGPGDAFLFNSRVPHRFRNVGRDDCIAVTACTPPSF